MPQPVLTAEQRKRKPVRIETSGAAQAERDRIALGRIEAYMDAHTSGFMLCPECGDKHKIKQLTPAVATLMRARYDKLRPTLSAVEQTMVDPRDKADVGDLEAKLKALFDAKPELFSFIPKPAATQQTPVIPASSTGGVVTH